MIINRLSLLVTINVTICIKKCSVTFSVTLHSANSYYSNITLFSATSRLYNSVSIIAIIPHLDVTSTPLQSI